MHVTLGTAQQIIDRFESALDAIHALDRVPFHIKREAAEKAAVAVVAYLRRTE